MQLAQKSPIIIVGAGLGGLTLALALRKLGLPCLVLERSPGLSEIGAGITLWENALRVLEQVGAIERVQAIAQKSEAGVLGTASGQTLVRTSLAQESTLGRLWAAHRAELQEALYRGLPEGTVRFGVTVERFEDQGDGVSLLLTDGSQMTAPLLVGADGLHSQVRRALFGEEALRYAGYAAYRGICPKPEGYSGPVGEFFGQGDRFGVVELPGNRLYWYAVLSQPLGTPRAPAARALLDARFAHYAFDVPRILQASSDETILYHELFDRPPSPRFSRGRVVLLGDAAHPTTPNMGQGAAMALESAFVLALSLSRWSVEDALQRYQTLRAPRTARVTETSRKIGQVAQLQNPVLAFLRNLAFRLVPERVRLAELRWVVSYNAGALL